MTDDKFNKILEVVKDIQKDVKILKSENNNVKEMIKNLTSTQENFIARVDRNLHLITADIRGPVATSLKLILKQLGLEPINWVEEQKKTIKKIKMPVSVT